MGDLLVDKMRNKGGAAVTDALVVALEGFPKLGDESVDQKLAHLGELGVHDRDHGCIDWREWQTGSLCLHDASAKQTSSTDEVLVEELWHDVLDI